MWTRRQALQSGYQFRRSIGLSLAGWGNALAVSISPDNTRFRYIPPELWQLDDDDRYRVFNRAGKYSVFDSADVLHFKGPSLDGRLGLSPIQVHRTRLAAAHSEVEYGESFFTKSMRLSGVLKLAKKVSQDEADTLYNRFMGKYGSNRERAGGIGVLGSGTEFEPLKMISPADAEYIQSRNFTRSEICSIWRVPGIYVNDLSKATYSNVEQLAKFFVTHTITPYLREFETEAHDKVLGEDDDRHFFEHQTSALLSAITKDRFAAYKSAIDAGWIAPNEIRTAENLPKSDVESMNEPRRPLNTVPVSEDDTDDTDDVDDGAESEDDDAESEERMIYYAV